MNYEVYGGPVLRQGHCYYFFEMAGYLIMRFAGKKILKGDIIWR